MSCPETDILCVFAPSAQAKVSVFENMTLQDLRDVLFSVTDISPDDLCISLPSGVHVHPYGPPAASVLVSQVGIKPSMTVHLARCTHSAAPDGGGASTPSKPASGAISLSDLSAALSSVMSSSRGVTASAASVNSGTEAGRAYLRRLRAYYSNVLEYQEPRIQDKARAVMPLADLRQRAVTSAADGECADTALAKELLQWFKNEFFAWVDKPSCWSCGWETRCLGSVEPTMSERKYRANMVEFYECVQCRATQRFARFNDPSKLLETRRGRCGEWAQAFTLVAIAAGLEARLVHDETDHVWTEIWSPRSKRWLHADSCENCLDEPLIYEEGWNKKLSYIVAVGSGSVADVTRRYTNKFSDVLGRRTIASETWLRDRIAELNHEAVSGLPAAQRPAAIERASADAALLARSGESGSEEREPQSLPGRISGSTDWVQARGEDGKASKRNPKS